jgi:hypothetical protein
MDHGFIPSFSSKKKYSIFSYVQVVCRMSYRGSNTNDFRNGPFYRHLYIIAGILISLLWLQSVKGRFFVSNVWIGLEGKYLHQECR